MKIQVSLKNYRRSARKVREIIPVIKGLSVEEALEQLAFIDKAAAYDLKKLLLSGIATAENDFNLSKEELLIGNVMVQEGKTLKRWRARAYGRAAQILKRTCHILLTIQDKKDSMESTAKEKNQDRKEESKSKKEKQEQKGEVRQTEKKKGEMTKKEVTKNAASEKKVSAKKSIKEKKEKSEKTNKQ